MDMIEKVRRLRLRKKLTISEIAKVTGISRPTVRKWLCADVASPPHYERVSSQTKLSAFKQTLELALRADSHRPKHARRTGKDLYKQAQAQGYRGSYSRVTDFIREWRQEAVKDPAKAFVPLAFELGEAFSLTGARRVWWWAACTTACRSLTSSCAPAGRSGCRG